MKRNNILALLSASSVAFAALQGCGGGGSTGTGGASATSSTSTGTTTTSSTTTSSTTTSSTTTSTGAGTTGSGGSMGFPPVPALGAQIDRMGRPAINTALNHTFDPDATAKGKAKDAYNQQSDTTKWVAGYTPGFETTLGILDALDTVCGNQALADKTKMDASRYAGMAGALADDRLWIKTDAADCTVYLAVEANATNLMANADCGGRTLTYNPIDESYSLLAAGMLSGVTNGITADADVPSKTFPYIAAPH